MSKFRIILTLLLCLTVPVAGWASVLSGPFCPQPHQHRAPKMATHDQAVADQVASATSESEHHHEHCGGTANHGKPCKGDHCACGCGTGACASSTLLLLAPSLPSFTTYAGSQVVPLVDEPPYAVARGTSPLRPPIS